MFPVWAGAQRDADTAADSTYTLEKMVISATRRETRLKYAPAIAFVIDKNEMKKSMASRPSDALEYVPGLDIECGTGVGVPSKKNIAINGLPSFHNIVLVDGKRMLSSHFHTGANIDMVPAANIERIEIIKDASSSMYGSDALGGVINIITRKGTQEPRLEYEVSGGSRSTARTGVSLTGRTTDNILHSAFAGWEQSDGLPLVEGKRKEQLEFKQLTIMDKIDFLAGENGRIGTSIHYSRLFDMPISNTPFDAWLFTPGIDYDFAIGKHLTITGQNYYTQWYAEQPTGQSPEKNELASPSLWVTYSRIPSNLITIGGEYVWRNFMRQGVLEHDQHFGGVFAQDEVTLLNRLTILGAIRADYVKNTAPGADDNGPCVSPKLSLLYRPVDFLAVRAGAGAGFRAPYIQDLYESRYHPSGGGIWRYGNLDLKSETSRSANAGLDWDILSGLNLKINGYYNRLENMIALSRGTKDSSGVKVYRDTAVMVNSALKKVPVWERVNINSYRIGGFEGTIAYAVKYATLEIGGCATWHSSNDEKAADALQYPGQKAFGKLSGTAPIGQSFVCNGFIGVQRVFNRHASTGGGELDDYTNLEAGLGATFKGKVELYVKGKNLLGQKMEMYEDALWTIEGVPLFESGLRLKAF